MPRSRRAEAIAPKRAEPSSARRLALTALVEWRRRQVLADAIAVEVLSEAKLAPRDRAFALELFYGVLRKRALLDYWIALLRSSRVDVDLRDVLRLGLYQLFVLGTPPHAAVNETVAVASMKTRNVANAVLRSALRGREEMLAKAAEQPLSIRASHPQFLVDRWQRQFGNESTARLCSWNNQAPPLYARINTLKISHTEFLRAHPRSRPLAHASNFVALDAIPHQALAGGHCYIQDASTAIACQLLDPQPGEKILDACAAPGGKSGYLAELMKNDGLLIACDRAADRLHLLRENLSQLGVTIASVQHVDWTMPRMPDELAAHAPFDKILIDAPCSNTGVMRRRVDVRWRLRPDDFARMQDRQLAIARAVEPLLKLGGTFVYSTCSLEREENEEVVERLLDDSRGWRLAEVKSTLPFRDEVDGAFAAKLIRDA